MSKSSFVHAMQQQQNAHDPGASQLSSIHSRSSAHVNQIQGGSSAQGKMSAGIGMLMEQRPGALPMGILILSLIAIFFCVCLCVVLHHQAARREYNRLGDCGPYKLALRLWGRRPASMKPRPSLSGQDSAAEVELREPVATIVVTRAESSRPTAMAVRAGSLTKKQTPPPPPRAAGAGGVRLRQPRRQRPVRDLGAALRRVGVEGVAGARRTLCTACATLM